jgi:hypothetical protein
MGIIDSQDEGDHRSLFVVPSPRWFDVGSCSFWEQAKGGKQTRTFRVAREGISILRKRRQDHAARQRRNPAELPAGRLHCGAGTDEVAVLLHGIVWIGENGWVAAAGWGLFPAMSG